MESESKLVEITKHVSLSEKCIQTISSKKLDISENEISFFINDDVLERFMIARDNKETKALEMWLQWAEWRIKYKPESITPNEIKNEVASGKAYLHGYDKEGRPCIVVKNCKHLPDESDFDEVMRFFIYTVDSACKLADENGSKKIVAILDREGVSMKNMDRRFLGQMGLVGVLQDYYAERLHKAYVLHVNWIYKMLYGIVKPFLSERTKSKIHICGSVSNLKTFFNDENLLKEHGGTSEFIYKGEI